MKTYIGIDNGTSGSIGIIRPDSNIFIPTPIFMQDSYTKPELKKKTKKAKKRTLVQKRISRVTHREFKMLLDIELRCAEDVLVILERPMINPRRFAASMSAMRCLESQLVAIEDLGISYRYIDSKEWQKEFIPHHIKGADHLKLASLCLGLTMYPQHKELFSKQGDADSMLIAEYAKRMNW